MNRSLVEMTSISIAEHKSEIIQKTDVSIFVLAVAIDTRLIFKLPIVIAFPFEFAVCIQITGWPAESADLFTHVQMFSKHVVATVGTGWVTSIHSPPHFFIR